MSRTPRMMPPGLETYSPVSRDPALYYDPVLRLGIAWLDTENEVETNSDQPYGSGLDDIGTRALIESVAGIVAIAADRARKSGELLILRDAVERALGPMPFMARGPNDPREKSMATLPAIRDTDRAEEVKRLATLMSRHAAT